MILRRDERGCKQKIDPKIANFREKHCLISALRISKIHIRIRRSDRKRKCRGAIGRLCRMQISLRRFVDAVFAGLEDQRIASLGIGHGIDLVQEPRVVFENVHMDLPVGETRFSWVFCAVFVRIQRAR